ncbi:MAG: ligB [Methanomicrobia archaeon]|nr:ligB [Methanomicrobia archaeon]
MRYSRIASALEEISGSPRGGKADRTSALLREAAEEPEMLCPVVRLLTGELWPRWEGREMGIGPETIAAALVDVCDIDLSIERQQKGDMGLVAEAALEHKGQSSLFGQPLDALAVYEDLRRISSFKGSDSDQRKMAVLRGLFLLASPEEGKFIARTALRSMQAGLGPRTMIEAISSALACDAQSLARAYGLMPDLGCIAEMARLGRLDEVFIQPNLPARLMIYSVRGDFFPGAYLPKFPGLRVQVHKAGETARIFSSQLRDISSSLSGLCQDVARLNSDFVADALLIGFLSSHSPEGSAMNRICSGSEMLRYINRRRLARKSSIRPALLVYDLLAVEGKDICSLSYAHRRQKMLSALGPPRSAPFYGISPAEQQHLKDIADLDAYLCLARRDGASGLLARDYKGIYRPGELSERDFIIRAAHIISALVVGVEWITRKNGQIRARYLVALRQEKALVTVGRVWRTRSDCSFQPLSMAAASLNSQDDALGSSEHTRILLKIRIGGIEKAGPQWRIIEPVIEDYSLDSSIKDADELDRLNNICPK